MVYITPLNPAQPKSNLQEVYITMNPKPTPPEKPIKSPNFLKIPPNSFKKNTQTLLPKHKKYLRMITKW